jgi:O-succinylbenzoate synthase
MNIDQITLTHVRVPLVEPFKISNGEIAEKDAIIVGVYSEGLVGHGESSPMSGSFYSAETPESTWACLVDELIPTILHSHPSGVEEVNDVINRVPSNSFAKAGIETAFWDLAAQRQDTPLCKCLGAKRNQVESGLAVGIFPSIKDLLRSIEKHLAEGYKRVKIKIQPGWDVKPLTEIRGEFGAIQLMVDANCAYTQADLHYLKTLDDFGLMMIEQPLPKDDLEGHAKLQAISRTPVCLDEGAKDLQTVQRAIELKSCRIVNIKIQRVGGLLNALRMHELCAQAGIPVWGGTMPELGIGGVQTVHLATLDNFKYPTDVESSKRWFVEDIIDPLIEVIDGVITLPDRKGNGYTLNARVVEKYKVREVRFR